MDRLNCISHYISNRQQSRTTIAILKSLISEEDRYINAGLNFFRIDEVWYTFRHIFEFYRKWLGTEVWFKGWRFSVELENVWRFVPFIDHDEWAKYVEKLGLPYAQQNLINIPDDLPKLRLIERQSDVPAWLALCAMIGMAFGFPLDFASVSIFQPVLDQIKLQNNNLKD